MHILITEMFVIVSIGAVTSLSTTFHYWRLEPADDLAGNEHPLLTI